jgi:hypothetical protein
MTGIEEESDLEIEDEKAVVPMPPCAWRSEGF